MPEIYRDGIGLERCRACFALVRQADVDKARAELGSLGTHITVCTCAPDSTDARLKSEDTMAKRKTKTTKPKARTPRSQALPGIGDNKVRNQKLDNICEAINDERQRKNEADTEERTLLKSALELMQKKDIHAYKCAGVELARIPGSEKLRVRLIKEQGKAEISNGDESEGEELDDETTGDDERLDV